MSIRPRAEEVLTYWTDLGPQGWYAGGAALDAEIKSKFEGMWEEARDGGMRNWMCSPEGMMAYLILTDQFPRNMFRDEAKAFATDFKARRVAHYVWLNQWDLRMDEPLRQFFYMPLMHSESPFDQERCVALFKARMPETGENNLLHARAHREVIRRFRRFPFRNKALGRESTQAEKDWLAAGAYGAMVRELETAA